ncbi:hypothetical protein J6590_051902 [Homalodisca vitripennis]|nr:hypothetical protein J6590_051902 [Homalodisca vitripennis]
MRILFRLITAGQMRNRVRLNVFVTNFFGYVQSDLNSRFQEPSLRQCQISDAALTGRQNTVESSWRTVKRSLKSGVAADLLADNLMKPLVLWIIPPGFSAPYTEIGSKVVTSRAPGYFLAIAFSPSGDTLDMKSQSPSGHLRRNRLEMKTSLSILLGVMNIGLSKTEEEVQKNQPSPGILPPALAGAPESPELAPDPSVTPTCTFQYSFLHPVVVTGLCYLHRPVTTTLYSPRRPPQPSGRGCDVRDLRTNPGDSGDLSK